MCRVLSYLGFPIVLEELLYKTDNSFIKQSYHPKYMSHLLNLAGFGFVAWDTKSYDSKLAYIYKTSHLPFYDENLRNLSHKIVPHCLLTHLRGVAYNEKQVVSQQNVHPFIFDGTNIALAHNGYLFNFDKMKYELLNYINTDLAKQIKGTTDSEWIYALFLSQFSRLSQNYNTDDVANAIVETLKILLSVRKKLNIAINSPVNLFITNGEFIAATRFVFDYGWETGHKADPHFSYHSLWYTYGERYGFYEDVYKMKQTQNKSSIIISSEPLTEDTSTWIEVPEYTLLVARLQDNEIQILSKDLTI